MSTAIKNPDGSISDPTLYKRLLEPFPSKESATDSLSRFYEEFRELREKHGIPDAVLIVRSIYMDQEEKQDTILTMHCGDAKLIFPMVAVTYERQREKLLASMGLAAIPAAIFDSSEFFSDFLIYSKAVATQDEAEALIKGGEVKVNGKPILIDGPAPEGDFVLTVCNESFKIPGKKRK